MLADRQLEAIRQAYSLLQQRFPLDTQQLVLCPQCPTIFTKKECPSCRCSEHGMGMSLTEEDLDMFAKTLPQEFARRWQTCSICHRKDFTIQCRFKDWQTGHNCGKVICQICLPEHYQIEHPSPVNQKYPRTRAGTRRTWSRQSTMLERR